ncbi:MAG: restriction endonuclease subunit S [Enterovibrio sp.]
MVPKGWHASTLGKLAVKIGSGITPKGGSDSYKKLGIPLIRSQNVLWGSLSLSDVAYIDENQHEKMKGSTVLQGDVLLNITGASIGRAAVSNLNKANVNQHVCIIRTNALIPEYLKNFLLSFNGQKQIEQFQAGGNRQGLNFEQIKSFRVPVPPLPEQKKIAQILSTWDGAITTSERLLDLARQQKKALMQQLLTGKKRLLDKNGVRFSGEWALTSIAQMGQVVSGGTPDTENSSYWNGDVYWLTPTDVTALDNKYVKNTNRKITVDGVKYSAAKLLPQGTLLICSRATIGAMAISTTEITTNQGFKNLIPNNKHCVEFLYFIFGFFVNQFIRKASGSTFLELSKYDFERLEFFIPNLAEQQKIAAVLSSADQEITTLQSQLAALKQEKKALMQQLLTGKRRVLVS